MWSKCFIAVVFILSAYEAAAQSSEELDAVMQLTGCGQPENLDEYEVERLCHYLEHPVRINTASVSFLRSCGLFSAYQAASLIDYRVKHGDVMSLNELSSVDGFSPERVRALSPFISLAGGGIGERTSGMTHDLAVKGGVSVSDRTSGGYGMKYRFTAGDMVSASLSFSRANDERMGAPDTWSASLAWDMKRIPLRIVAGDFNARFGQGLALWNGFSMSGAGKTSSFMKSSSGLSSSWSFTGSSALTGIATELSVAKMRLSALLAMPGIKRVKTSGACLMPALNLGWYGMNMTASLTHYAEFARSSSMAYIPDMKTSADVALCLQGIDIFGEVAFDWVNMSAAVLAGTVFPLGEEFHSAVHVRYYPSRFNPSRSAAMRSGSKCSNEYAMSVSSDYQRKSGRMSAGLSVDASYRPEPQSETDRNVQVKILSDCSVMCFDSFQMKLRLSERIRTWGQRFRTDARMDLEWTRNRFAVSSRINLLRCKGTGFLSYAEGGYKTDDVSVYLRTGVYRIDNWDDRIYVYERDAPGSFTVPAMYGRGVWVSFSASWRYARWGRLYVRAAKKPGKAELKLQSVFSF